MNTIITTMKIKIAIAMINGDKQLQLNEKKHINITMNVDSIQCYVLCKVENMLCVRQFE